MSSDVVLVGSWLGVLAYAVAQPLSLMRMSGGSRVAAALPLVVTAPVFALVAISYTGGCPLLPTSAVPLVCSAAVLYLLGLSLGAGSGRG